ncbi:(2Fe-2S)-binding protein [Candidatus Pacearchaeota archaeon]|nr:(2Fe-2S)-binding protein [Candidatus Pacearchaeota archaeon]
MAELARVDENGEIEEIVEAPLNDELVEPGEKLGVAFGCIDGRCGSCRVEVTEGMDNFSELTKNELDAGMTKDEPYRLLCQCRIKKGVLIKIKI